MGSLINYIETGIALAIMFTVLVAAHELGHYLFARLFKMGVEEFAIGFGRRPILEWMRRTYEIKMRPGEVPQLERASPPAFDLESSASRPQEDIVRIESPGGDILRETTRFTVRAWPLGGFVRIKGMVPEEDGSETKIAGGFYSKPPWQRLIVLFAGPMFSVLAGILILIPLYMIAGKYEPDNQPILGVISKDGPAAKAGLQEKDQITSIGGKRIDSFYGLVQVVRDSAGKDLTVDVLRDGHPLSFIVVPQLDKEPTNVLDAQLNPTPDMRRQGRLLAGPKVLHIREGLRGAMATAVSEPIQLVSGLIGMIHHPATIKENVGGPLAITEFTYESVLTGFAALFQLAALLSITVGIMNLLPIAPMDGGQIALALAEMLRGGKRLSIQVQSAVTFAGMIVIVGLIFCACFMDLSRMFDANAHKVAPVTHSSK